MILTRDVILREIASGRLVIDPLDPAQIGPGSIDLHLGDEIRVMAGGPERIEVTEAADYRAVTRLQRLDDPHVLRPGETIHAITRERIRLPPDVAGWLEGRSRFARLGLMIHVTSGFVAPGVDSRQVLEMSNVAGRPLVIHAGVPVCQIVLQRCEGEAVYAGRFRDQQSLT
jgi:dCTP deaminase